MDEQDVNGQDRHGLWPDESMTEWLLSNKRFLKGLAVLIVFLISFSIPVIISFVIQEDAKNMRIKLDMGQLRNWAEVYRLENKNYKGFEIDPDIERAIKDIKDMSGSVHIFVGKKYDSYCVKAVFRKGSFCVDDSGYVGKDGGVCSPHVTKCN